LVDEHIYCNENNLSCHNRKYSRSGTARQTPAAPAETFTACSSAMEIQKRANMDNFRYNNIKKKYKFVNKNRQYFSYVK